MVGNGNNDRQIDRPMDRQTDRQVFKQTIRGKRMVSDWNNYRQTDGRTDTDGQTDSPYMDVTTPGFMILVIQGAHSRLSIPCNGFIYNLMRRQRHENRNKKKEKEIKISWWQRLPT